MAGDREVFDQMLSATPELDLNESEAQLQKENMDIALFQETVENLGSESDLIKLFEVVDKNIELKSKSFIQKPGEDLPPSMSHAYVAKNAVLKIMQNQDLISKYNNIIGSFENFSPETINATLDKAEEIYFKKKKNQEPKESDRKVSKLSSLISKKVKKKSEKPEAFFVKAGS